tara:strand:- start:6971 stop:7147 length:177 start_codon:yes stop_codon:yes gene_type:complete
MSRGGEIVAEGTPEAVVEMARSYTGHFLSDLLEGRPGKRVEAAAGTLDKTFGMARTGR